MIHLVSGHEQTEQGAKVVVGDRPGKGPSKQGLPKFVALFVFLKTAAHNTPLRAKEGLVGRPRNHFGPLDKGLLEVGADEPQHMGHIVHQYGVDVLGIQELSDLGNRLLVKDHALAKDNQLGSVGINELQRGRDINHVGIVGQDREIHHSRPLRPRVSSHKVL